MFARLYLWITVSLLLLGGALVAAPAAALDPYAAPAVAVSSPGGDCTMLPGCAAAHEAADLAQDTPPLLAEMPVTSLLPRWLAKWAPAGATDVVGILLFLPDEPPKRPA